MASDWDKRHKIWLETFSRRKEAPPGGWAKYLGATWLPREEWFPRYRLYLKSHAWKQRRWGVLRRAGNKCQLCPATTHLEVHHVTYNRVGAERIEDMRCLCRTCHQSLEESGNKYIPADQATSDELRRRYELLKDRRENPPKPKTRRRPMADSAPLKDRC